MSESAAPTLTAERRAAIADIVGQRGAARVAELAERFDVSATTVRRDLEELEEREVVRRVHGGAVAPGTTAPPSDPTEGGEEARIGRATAEMIAEGETIFLGPGELPLEVARCLDSRSRMTVVTNGLEVGHWLASNTSHNTIVTGGQVEGRRGLGLVGELTRTALSKLRADRVILELGGVSPVEGLTHDSLPQAEIAQMVLGTGSEVIAVVPAERVGRVAAAHVGDVADIDILVTAREAPSSFLWDLSEAGVRVVLA